jgi:uncharacterized protein YcfJ
MNTIPAHPPEKSRLHPLVAIAAISVTAFSLFGIAAINGWLPSGKATSSATPSTSSAVATPSNEAPPAEATAPAKAQSAPKMAQTAPNAEKPLTKAAPKPMPKPAAKPAAAELAQAPVEAAPVAQVNAPPATVSAPVAQISAPPAPPVCGNCGVIDDIREISQPGEATGLGAIAGGVIGGILGHQIGGGTGKKLATVAGAAGGAYAGHQIEKAQRQTTRYEVTVRMNDGARHTVMMDSVAGWRIGERVRIENGVLVRD